MMKANKETRRGTRLLKLLLTCTVIFTTLTFVPKQEAKAADVDDSMPMQLMLKEEAMEKMKDMSSVDSYSYSSLDRMFGFMSIINLKETKYGGNSILLMNPDTSNVMRFGAYSTSNNNEYRTSDWRTTLIPQWVNQKFTSEQQEYFLDSRRAESAPYTTGYEHYQWQDCAIEGDKFFPLRPREVPVGFTGHDYYYATKQVGTTDKIAEFTDKGFLTPADANSTPSDARPLIATNLDTSKLLMVRSKDKRINYTCNSIQPYPDERYAREYTPIMKNDSLRVDVKKAYRDFAGNIAVEFEKTRANTNLAMFVVDATGKKVAGAGRMLYTNNTLSGTGSIAVAPELLDKIATDGYRIMIGEYEEISPFRMEFLSTLVDITDSVEIPEQKHNVTLTNLFYYGTLQADKIGFTYHGDDIRKGFGDPQDPQVGWSIKLSDYTTQTYYYNADNVRLTGFKYEPLGFDPMALNQDVQLTALYGQNSVLFRDTDGNVYEQAIFTNGGTFTTPSDPPLPKKGYIFKEWKYDPPIADMTAVTTDVVATPIYEKKLDATVQYKDDAGNLLHEEVVLIGEGAKEIPTPPVKAGFRFTGWTLDPVGSDLTNITENVVATATYIQEFTYTYYSDDAGTVVIDSKKVDKGTKVTVPATPTKAGGYRFDKWEYSNGATDATALSIDRNYTAKPVFVKYFEVEFRDHLNSVFKPKQLVDKDKNAIPPESNPTKEYYHFSVWDNFYKIQEDKMDAKAIKPNFLAYKYTLETERDLYAYTTQEAQAIFDDGDSTNEGIKKTIRSVYRPEVYRDGFKQKKGDSESIESGIYADEIEVHAITENIAKIKAGVKGMYDITFSYQNTEALKQDRNEESFKAEKTVTIKITDEASEIKNPGTGVGAKIAANNFTLSVNEVKAIWAVNLVKLGSAQAVGSDGKAGIVTVGDKSKILPEPGVYPMTFKADVNVSTPLSAIKGLNTIETLVNVTVKDDSNVDERAKEQINGNNFTIKKEEVTSINGNSQAFIDLAKVKAVDMKNGTELPVYIDTPTLKEELGQQEVIFRTANNTVLKVIATVKEEENTIPESKEKINGNHFSIKTDTVKELQLVSKEERNQRLVTMGDVQAVDTDTYAKIAIDSVDSSALKPKLGTYDIIYKTAKGTSVTLQASVIDDSIVDDVNKEQISGSDFTLKTSEVNGATLQKDSLIALAKAKAKSTLTNAEVEITTVEHNVVGKVGDYPITFGTALGTKVTIYAHVRDQVEINTEDNESITGNNLILKTSEVGSISDARLMLLSNVKAIHTETKETIPVRVKSHTILPVVGDYEVVFTTENTDLTIQVKVQDESLDDENTREHISASNFTIKTSEVKDLTEDLIKEKANVQAYHLDIGEEKPIIKVDSGIQAMPGTYYVTFSTQAGTSITIMVFVVDAIVSKGDEVISGSGFMIKKSEVGKLTDEKLIQLSNSKAYDVKTGKACTVYVEASDIVAKVGVYDVVYTTDKGTALTVQATVQDEIVEDEVSREHLSANHFIVKTSEVKELTEEKIKEKAELQAYHMDTGEALVNVHLEGTVLERAGEYPITFKTTNGTALTITATVVDQYVENVEAFELLTAGNFTVKTSEVKDLTNDDIIALANAKAIDTKTGNSLVITVATSEIVQKAGVYDVTFTTGNTDITVQATIQDVVVENPIAREHLGASNFTVKTSEVKDLTEDVIKQKAELQAYHMDTGKPLSNVTVGGTILPIAGEYPVTFQTPNTSIQVNVEVVDEIGIPENGVKESITANHFNIKTSEASSITTAFLITKAQVKASDLSTGANLDVQVYANGIATVVGTYEVVFGTENGTKVTVKATVSDEVYVDEANKEGIIGSNFSLTTAKVGSLTNESIIEKARAKAWSTSTGEAVAITNVTHQIKAQGGNYNVVLATEKGTSITIVAMVYDESSTNPDGNIPERITGSHFVIATKDVSTTTEEQLKQLGNVKATNLITGEAVHVIVKTRGIEAHAGVYDVVYATGANTTLTLKATVKDVVKEELGEHISGNNFTITTSEVKSLNDQEIIKRANIQAYDLTTGVALTGVSIRGEVNSYPGTYPITITTSKANSITIMATVVDVIGKPEEGIKESISGNHFSLTSKEVEASKASPYTLIQLGNVKAYNTTTGANVEVEVVEENIGVKAGEYQVTYSTKQNTRLTVKVNVYDETTTDTDKKEAIKANHFTLSVAEARVLSDAMILEKSQVQAYRLDTGEKIGGLVISHGIKARAGDYDVVLQTPNGTKVTVKALVRDENITNDEKHEYMSGSHFVMKSSDVESIDEDTLISLGNVKASNTVTGKAIDVQVKTNGVKARAGVYAVVYTTGNTDLTLQVTVQDEINNHETNKEHLSASHFVVKTNEVASLTEQGIKERANLIAYSLDTGLLLTDVTTTHSIQSLPGSYPVTFATTKDTKITVMATVVDVTGTPEEGVEESITANHIVVKKSDVARLLEKEQALIELANVKAYNTQTGKSVKVRVESNLMTKKVGNYEVVFTTDLHTKIKINATVVDEYITNEDTKESIYGNHFDILIKEVPLLTNEMLINKASVYARSTQTGVGVPIVHVEHSIKAVVGSYEVTFQTQAGTKITVKANVKEESVEDIEKDERISASGFIVTTKKAAQLTDTDFIQLADAKAQSISNGESIEVLVDKGDFVAQRGMYEVTYKTKKGTAIKVIVEVRDEVVINDKTREIMKANAIHLGVNEVPTITEGLLKQLSKVTANHLDTGAVIAITKVEHNIKATVGEYWASFKTDANTKIQVPVYVEDFVSSNENERITASNFKLSVSKVKTITDDQLIELAKAKALDIRTGNFVALRVTHALKAETGFYDITFTTALATTITVSVNVVDDSKVKEEVIGNSIYLSIEEAKAIDIETLKTKAKARAVDINSNKQIPITKVTTTVEPIKGVYEASFATEQGTSLIVDVYVNNENTLETKLGEQITGNSFTVRPEDVSKLNDVAILTLGNVKAVDLDTSEFVNVFVDKGALQAQEGRYTITLATSKNTTTSIDVEVKQEAPSMDVVETPTGPKVIIDKVTVVEPQQPITSNQEGTSSETTETDTETSSKIEKETNNKTNKEQTKTTQKQVNTTNEKMQWIVWPSMVVYGIYMVIKIIKGRG